MGLFFVDCEAYGECPRLGRLTEFAAVSYTSRHVFYAALDIGGGKSPSGRVPQPDPDLLDYEYDEKGKEAFRDFAAWLVEESPQGGRPVLVSDNPAFDWQWINDGFWRWLGRNPMGFSARRIGDFYAGLRGDFRMSNDWKKLRITPHTHDPRDDAMGNVEAFERMLKGER